MDAIRALNQRFDRTTIENRSWEQVFDAYDTPATFFFLDPPYLDDGGKCYEGWSREELARFCARLKTLKGRWVFTFQDCIDVRHEMKGYPIKTITRARGIVNKSVTDAGVYRELIITSR